MPTFPKLMRLVFGRWGSQLLRATAGRRFSGRTRRNALVIFEPNAISFSQVYPFIYYRDTFRHVYDVEFRFISSHEAIDKIPSIYNEASHVFLQTWLTDPVENTVRLSDRIREIPFARKYVYLDSFANNDARLFKYVSDFDLYYRKSLFVDSRELFRIHPGGTNLSAYYGRLFSLDQQSIDWGLPDTTYQKMRLSPNFLTDPDLIDGFIKGHGPRVGDRTIDLHARLGGTDADGWYGAMRRSALEKTLSLTGISLRVGTGVPQRLFRKELAQAKLCFSPFGFGEICWRDIEAIACGAVLIKPDMSHLRTEPNLYECGESYIPVRWDFADLQDKVSDLLRDETTRERIAATAWQRARSYLLDNGPVSAYASVFNKDL